MPSEDTNSASPILWRGTATNPVAMAVSLVFLAAAISAPFAGAYGTGAFAVILLATTITYTRVSLTIDRQELVVAMGPWLFPRRVHPVADIEWVEFISVTRNESKMGIGYRGSNKKLRGRAILLRPGDAIHFQGTRGIRHRVTVDGALGAVTVLERILPR
ncbi:MAG: hypothetical protein ACI8Y4_003096 [Candidatus Poriferisodalaceae bacterium]|jgi:hypothetical protein